MCINLSCNVTDSFRNFWSSQLISLQAKLSSSVVELCRCGHGTWMRVFHHCMSVCLFSIIKINTLSMFCELFCPPYISTKLRKNFLRSFKVNYSNCVLVNTGCWVCVLLCFLNMKLSVLGSPTSPVETCYCYCANVCFVFGSEYKTVLSEMYHQ